MSEVKSGTPEPFAYKPRDVLGRIKKSQPQKSRRHRDLVAPGINIVETVDDRSRWRRFWDNFRDTLTVQQPVLVPDNPDRPVIEVVKPSATPISSGLKMPEGKTLRPAGPKPKPHLDWKLDDTTSS